MSITFKNIPHREDTDGEAIVIDAASEHFKVPQQVFVLAQIERDDLSREALSSKMLFA